MRILAFCDLHDEEDALERLRAYYKKEKFDYVLIAGDTSNGSVSFMEDTLNSFPNAFLVPGNNEPKGLVDQLYLRKGFIHCRRVEIEKSLNIVGFGYSTPTPYGTPGEMDEDAIYSQLSKMNIDKNTLLLCHCPPKGMFDFVKGSHIGSESIKRIIEEKKPLAMFCGHAHELDGVLKHHETTVIKIPAALRNKACAVAISGRDVTVQVVDI